MFANRISRFLIEEPAAPVRTTSGFALLPSYSVAGAGALDIYRLAYEQAVQQVADRRERQRRAHEWN